MMLLSGAAASFGGTSWLAWYPGGKDDKRAVRTEPAHAAPIARSVPWLVAGAVTLVVFIAVLGPGVRL